MSRQKILLVLMMVCISFSLKTFEVWGAVRQKTPDDTYANTQIILDHIAYIREQKHIDEPITIEIPPQRGKTPGHVLQKTYEILEKISKFRVNNSQGQITIPPFPAREITPNEVYESTQRIIQELNLLEKLLQIPILKIVDNKGSFLSKTPNDVYRSLWQISVAFDTLLGVRGFTPNDVYIQTQRLLKEIKFLRNQQEITETIMKPKKTKGKHPNHALVASYELLDEIILVEKNLWMAPASSKKVPLRVITPTEVYDSLEEILAEIQRIKFRLSVEYVSPVIKRTTDKTPDDVIQNLVWAKLLMPKFNTFQVKQNKRKSLQKTPAHVYVLTGEIIKELRMLRKEKHIDKSPREMKEFFNKEPKHVFVRTMECLDKVSIYRQASNLGEITRLRHPLREITPNEVYASMFRLYQEIRLLRSEDSNQGLDAVKFTELEEKTPTDVFNQVSQVSQLLDTFLGEGGEYTPNDVFAKVQMIREEFILLCKKMGVDATVEESQYEEGKTPKDNMEKAFEILELVNQIKERAGIGGDEILESSQGEPLPEDVFNVVDHILANAIEIKLRLGITQHIEGIKSVSGKTPSHVYEQMEQSKRLLESIINQYDYE